MVSGEDRTDRASAVLDEWERIEGERMREVPAYHMKTLIAQALRAVRKDALEEAARVAEGSYQHALGDTYIQGQNKAATYIAAAIRALGEKEE